MEANTNIFNQATYTIQASQCKVSPFKNKIQFNFLLSVSLQSLYQEV